MFLPITLYANVNPLPPKPSKLDTEIAITSFDRYGRGTAGE
jgi:hypothetical protein